MMDVKWYKQLGLQDVNPLVRVLVVTSAFGVGLYVSKYLFF